MRILILGHRGLLGSELFGRLSAHHQVVGKDVDDFDIASEDACRRIIAEAEPEVVINAAGYTDVDGSEGARELCFAVNAEGVKNVALACYPGRIKIVHFSTDYVFDGIKDRPYREEDACHPLNVYGEAKLAGEKNLQQYSNHYLLVRTAWMYGNRGRNFVKTILEKAREIGRLEVVDDQKGSPTYAKDLAAAVELLLAGHHTGIFHVTNRGACSWYEFALKILAYADITDVPVTPVGSFRMSRPAVRPCYAVLNCGKFIETTGKAMQFWQLALQDYMRALKTGGN
ncbi:MAG: dTDP-4-dehydrorhamnose reductase [Deltaproteobacteria bacterium]|nr:dTDP-4-dehydrorhamnose reductase [Deltaproteobacteria bacterium]